jgi:regulatory protein
MEAPARITALEADPRSPESVRVEIDGVRFGAVSRAVIDVEGLRPGHRVDPALHERLAAAADLEAAYRTIPRSLEVRSYARNDLARRMVRKGHRRPVVDAALERAASVGLLDDAAFAEFYVQTRAARGRGPSRLTRDLLSMGVDRGVIDRVIAAQWPEGADCSSMPLALAQKRAAQLADLPRQSRRRRVLAYLARRGFSGHEVVAIVDRVI